MYTVKWVRTIRDVRRVLQFHWIALYVVKSTNSKLVFFKTLTFPSGHARLAHAAQYTNCVNLQNAPNSNWRSYKLYLR